jgi:hypothetical protein
MRFVQIAAGVDRDALLGSARRDAGERVSDAAQWLEGMLADGDWHDSAGLKKLAAAQDISERTLKRAAGKELGVDHERRGFPSVTYWRLPRSQASHLHPSILAQLGNGLQTCMNTRNPSTQKYSWAIGPWT